MIREAPPSLASSKSDWDEWAAWAIGHIEKTSKPKPQGVLKVPDVLGELHLVRFFRLAPDTFELESVGSTYTWKPGPQKASCAARHPREMVPAMGCGCGFWLLTRDADLLWERIQGYGGPLVVANVKGWGNAIEGSHGYRVEYAEIESLIEIPKYPPNQLAPRWQVRYAAKRYGVPTVVDESFNHPEVWKEVHTGEPDWVFKLLQGTPKPLRPSKVTRLVHRYLGIEG